MTLKETFREMKLRPGMFITDEDLDNLYAYLNGYMCRYEKDGAIPEFCPGFQKYIKELYHVTTGQRWSKIIKFYSNNNHEAMERFFQHLEDFMVLNGDGS